MGTPLFREDSFRIEPLRNDAEVWGKKINLRIMLNVRLFWGFMSDLPRLCPLIYVNFTYMCPLWVKS
jgi:hypothetical protein